MQCSKLLATCCSNQPPVLTYRPALAPLAFPRRYVIDAEGQTLGRVASLAAYYIRGKHLPTYTPSMDMGAYGEHSLGLLNRLFSVVLQRTCDKGTAQWIVGADGACRVPPHGHGRLRRGMDAAVVAAAAAPALGYHPVRPESCRPHVQHVPCRPPPAVVIVNAEKVAVTGRKETDKFYFRHTNGRPGGGKMEALRDLRQVRAHMGVHAWVVCLAWGRIHAAQRATSDIRALLPFLRCSLVGGLVERSAAPCCLAAELLADPSAALPPPSPQRLPERILEKCVKGMLPKGRIASPLFNHLKVRWVAWVICCLACARLLMRCVSKLACTHGTHNTTT